MCFNISDLTIKTALSYSMCLYKIEERKVIYLSFGMRSYATQWSQCSELAVPSLTATFPVSGHPYLKSAGGERRGAVRGRAVGSVRYIFKPGCGCFKKIHLQWPPSRSPNKDCQSIKNISDSPFPPPRHGVDVWGGGGLLEGGGCFFHACHYPRPRVPW